MKKLILVLLLGGFALTSCQKDDLSATTELEAVDGRAKAKGNNGKKKDQASTNNFELVECDAVKVAELYAGQNTYVGTVTVEENNGFYTVTYEAIPGYCFSEIHFESTNPDDGFDLKGGGNPNPGGFDYKNDQLGCESSWTFEVANQGTLLAAHAVVNCTDEVDPDFINNIPQSVDFCVTGSPSAGTISGSYWDINISNSALMGNYGAWCVDSDEFLANGDCFENMVVYNSLDTSSLPSGAFEFPENFDLVNWLLNQNFLGQIILNDGTPVVYDEIQLAIWNLVDDDVCCPNSVDGAVQANVDELISLAQANGEGYMPSACGDIIGLVIIPEFPATPESPADLRQAIIFPYVPDCAPGDCDETAWGRNSANSNDTCGNFPGGNWATFFVYDTSD